MVVEVVVVVVEVVVVVVVVDIVIVMAVLDDTVVDSHVGCFTVCVSPTTHAENGGAWHSFVPEGDSIIDLTFSPPQSTPVVAGSGSPHIKLVQTAWPLQAGLQVSVVP